MVKFQKHIANLPDSTVVVDLFGGSGLLSRAAKDAKPNCRVIYNDYDDYRLRLRNIPRTNALLVELRMLLAGFPKQRIIPRDLKRDLLAIVAKHHEAGFSDFITLSSSLLFSMNYALDLQELEAATLYNNIKQKDYEPADDYLKGLEIRKNDYRELFDEFKDNSNAFFICDPPYLSTDAKSYETYWNLRDYLAVMNCLRHTQFAFFTSDKSALIELLEWLQENAAYKNPLREARRIEVKITMNRSSKYTDIMFFKAD